MEQQPSVKQNTKRSNFYCLSGSDSIPQGKIDSRFSVDLGLKKMVQKGKGEVFVNASDIFNTLSIRKDIQGEDFNYRSNNFYETQVVRFGYSYKF
ncbi:TonB-dependent receptor [Flavobacterium tructae]